MRENPEGDPALSVPSVARSGAVLSVFFSWQVHPTLQLYTRKQNSREVFSIHFLLLFSAHSWSLFQFFGKQNVYEPNFANFSGDFQLDTVLNVPTDFQKICFSFFVG